MTLSSKSCCFVSKCPTTPKLVRRLKFQTPARSNSLLSMKLSRLFLTRAATLAALFLSLAPIGARATLDVSPFDGIPDIWALRFSSGALGPNADSDGDGQKNSAEAAAGTDPLQAGSVIKISSVTSDGSGVHLTFPTEQGKRYQVRRRRRSTIRHGWTSAHRSRPMAAAPLRRQIARSVQPVFFTGCASKISTAMAMESPTGRKCRWASIRIIRTATV